MRMIFSLVIATFIIAFSNTAPQAQQKSADSEAKLIGNKDQKKNAVREMMVENGAAQLQVSVRGEGETVVMLPSLGRSVRDFDALSERLIGNGFRVVLPEPRSIGKSVGPTDKLTLHDLAGDIACDGG